MNELAKKWLKANGIIDEKVDYCFQYKDYSSFEFRTKKHGLRLIVNGFDFLAEHSKGEKVLKCHKYPDYSFEFETEKYGYRYIVNGVDILANYSKGEKVIDWCKHEDYDKDYIEFETKERGLMTFVI